MPSIVGLRRFRAALRADADATDELPDRTWRRYVRGEFPKNLLWFLSHPEIMQALASDAAEWNDEDRARIAAVADARATAQAKLRTTPKPKRKR